MRRVAVVLAAVAAALFVLPLVGLLVRAPWSTALDQLRNPTSIEALRLSLVTSVASTAVSVVLGVPLAFVYATVPFRGKSVVRALTTLPMVLPPVVGGVALLFAFGSRGVVGQALGLRLPFTTAGAVLAQVFVAMPFLVLTVEAGLRAGDPRLEEAARSLGASPWFTFRRVTLPLLRPALLAGIVLCWARALGEFGATITFAGSFPGRTQTVPLAVYFQLERRPEDAIVLSLVLLAVSVAVLVALRDRYLSALR
jgi:molybdate transport system permease protein